jgi:hypothetical protein
MDIGNESSYLDNFDTLIPRTRTHFPRPFGENYKSLTENGIQRAQLFWEFGFWGRRVAVVAIGYHALGLNLRPSLPTDVPSAAIFAVINQDTARGTRNWS